MEAPFYRPSLDRRYVHADTLKIHQAELAELIAGEELQALIDDGYVSLGLIRPGVGPDTNRLGLDDIAAAEEIEKKIQGLGILAKFSFTFDKQSVNEFYDGPAKYDSMMPSKPLRNARFDNRWEEFEQMMTNGPTTALLLYGEDAVATWRAHLGHWNIEKYNDPHTIRGALGVDNYNNLVHGSDASENVSRELSIIARCIDRI